MATPKKFKVKYGLDVTGQILDGSGSAGTSGQVLTSGGSSSNVSWTTVGGGSITGSGTAGQVAYWSGSSAITGEGDLVYDATNNKLGVGLSGPVAHLHARGIGPAQLRLDYDANNWADFSVDNAGNLALSYNTDAIIGTADMTIGYATVAITNSLSVGGSLTVTGNLTVNGTTTTVNSTTLDVVDKNITVAKNNTTDAGADGAGITVAATNPKTFMYNNASTAFKSSEDMDLNSGKVYKINGTSVLSGSTLGSGVTSSSLTSVGTITTGTWSATTIAVNRGGTGLTSGTSGGVLYYSASGTLASSAALTANALVIGGGAGNAPSTTTTGTGILTFLGTPSSANLATAVTDETGSGSLMFGTSPTVTTSMVMNATGGTAVALKKIITATLTGSNQTLDSFAAATYRSAEYLIQVTFSTSYHTTKVVVVHDGTTAYITEYGTVATAEIATFDATVSGGNVILQATPTNASTVFRVVGTLFNV
jgi:hypothetical protein